MDRQFGRIFDRVRSDPKLRDNTIIIVASDNGPEGGLGTTGGLRGSKGMLWEGGIREPFIVWSPSRIAKDKVGSTNETTVLAGMDLSPTVLSLAGIKEPAEAKPDGVDMSDAFIGKIGAGAQFADHVGSSSRSPGSSQWMARPGNP